MPLNKTPANTRTTTTYTAATITTTTTTTLPSTQQHSRVLADNDDEQLTDNCSTRRSSGVYGLSAEECSGTTRKYSDSKYEFRNRLFTLKGQKSSVLNKISTITKLQAADRQRWRSSCWKIATLLSCSQQTLQTFCCLSLFLLSTTCSLCAASLCESGQSWWDPYKDKCIPCTLCQDDMIPLQSCQMHRDTVCGSIYDLKIDWVVLSKTEPNWKERRKFDGIDYGLDHHQLTAEQLQQLQDDSLPLDWQTAALFLAVLACLLFFIVAACILVHHMRQWRRMERRLDQDVEELSTKLMAKLAEVQSLEGGTFFIGNADALRTIPTAHVAATATTHTTLTIPHHNHHHHFMRAAATANFQQPQHVMLPAEKSDKHFAHDRRMFSTSTMKSGNVYIEENGGSKC